MSEEPIAFDRLYSFVQDLPFTHADEGVVVSAQVGEQEWPFVLDCAASISIIKVSANIDKPDSRLIELIKKLITHK